MTLNNFMNICEIEYKHDGEGSWMHFLLISNSLHCIAQGTRSESQPTSDWSNAAAQKLTGIQSFTRDLPNWSQKEKILQSERSDAAYTTPSNYSHNTVCRVTKETNNWYLNCNSSRILTNCVWKATNNYIGCYINRSLFSMPHIAGVSINST